LAGPHPCTHPYAILTEDDATVLKEHGASHHDGEPVYAMACLLLRNRLRVSEVCGIHIDELAEERWHHTVSIHGKGDQDALLREV
jgi:integrase